MKFNEFCQSIFEMIDVQPVQVKEETSLKGELEVDSLQMVNLITGLAEKYNVPFGDFIQQADKLQTLGGLYTIVRGE